VEEPLWQQCRDALMGVVDVASKYDDDGSSGLRVPSLIGQASTSIL